MYGAVAAPDLRSAEAGAAMLRARWGGMPWTPPRPRSSPLSWWSSPSSTSWGEASPPWVSADGASEVLDFFANVPGRPSFEGQDFRPVDVDWGESVQRFFVGRASSAVPGCVAGLCDLVERRGRLELAEVLAPAVRHAREGFVLSPFVARGLALLEEIFRSTPESEALFAPAGRLLREGDRLVLDELAGTLEALGRDGAALFATGRVARAVAADQEERGGLITAEDLAAYRPILRAPLDLSFRDRRVLLPPPPSTGGRQVALALLLWERLVPEVGLSREEWGLLMAQVLRVAFEADADWERQGPLFHPGGIMEPRLHEDPRQRDRLRLDDAGRIVRYLGDANLGDLAGRVRRRMMGEQPARARSSPSREGRHGARERPRRRGTGRLHHHLRRRGGRGFSCPARACS